MERTRMPSNLRHAAISEILKYENCILETRTYDI
jgi:hypothetical protein